MAFCWIVIWVPLAEKDCLVWQFYRSSANIPEVDWLPLPLKQVRFDRIATFCIRFSESSCDKACAGGIGDTIPNDLMRKQVDDCVKISSGIVDFEIGDIAFVR